MDLQKVGLKFFTEKGGDISLREFIPVFHRWIQEDKLEGMLVDVAEYTHVKEGPGVLLIAHEANYSLDETDGKRGLLYLQKRPGEKSPEEHLWTAFRRTLQTCLLLEGDLLFKDKLKFNPLHFQVFINDRMAAPYGAKSHEELEGYLRPFLDKFFGGSLYLILPEKDPQKRVGFEVKVEGSLSSEELLDRLKAN